MLIDVDVSYVMRGCTTVLVFVCVSRKYYVYSTVLYELYLLRRYDMNGAQRQAPSRPFCCHLSSLEFGDKNVEEVTKIDNDPNRSKLRLCKLMWPRSVWGHCWIVLTKTKVEA